MTTDYGSDWSCYAGLDPLGQVVSGSVLMGQVVFRALYCRNGRLYGSPNRVTLDVRDFLGSGIVASRDLPDIEAKCQAAASGDERILSAACSARLGDPQGRTLVLSVTGFGTQGPFNLVLNVTQVSVEVLRNQA